MGGFVGGMAIRHFLGLQQQQSMYMLRYGGPGAELPVFALKGLLFTYLAHNTGHALSPRAFALKASPEVSNVSSNLIFPGRFQCLGDSASSLRFNIFLRYM